MISQQWVLCPVCGNKTRTKIRKDTKLINFPLYCPKCRKESLINVKNQIVTTTWGPCAGPPSLPARHRRACRLPHRAP